MFDIIEREKKRQRESIVLIASEVMREMGQRVGWRNKHMFFLSHKQNRSRSIMMTRLRPLTVLGNDLYCRTSLLAPSWVLWDPFSRTSTLRVTLAPGKKTKTWTTHGSVST